MIRILASILVFSCGLYGVSVRTRLQGFEKTVAMITKNSQLRRAGHKLRPKEESKSSTSFSQTEMASKTRNDKTVSCSSFASFSWDKTVSSRQGDLKPLWVASYPGSGSELFRTLVQGLTGLDTDEIYHQETNCSGKIAACKTHWPLKIGGSARRWGKAPRERTQEFSQQAMVLLRNPAKAIPAHFNYKWEEQHGITGHSQQGSEAEWKEWRDRRFAGSIQAWKRLVTTWERESSYEVALYVAFEELTNSDKGPTMLQTVAHVFQDSMATVHDSDIPCLWQQLVQQHASKKRKQHQYTPSFTRQQQQSMLTVIDELLHEMAHRPDLLSILSQYRVYVQEELRVD